MSLAPKHKIGEIVEVTPVGLTERGRTWASKEGELYIIEGATIGIPTKVLIIGYTVEQGRVVYHARAVRV